MGKSSTYIRIDNRLLHGQVVQFWLPYLRIEQLIIADDLAAANQAMVSVYRMAVPKSISLEVTEISKLSGLITRLEGPSTLVVLADLFDLARAMMSNFDCQTITLGNIHSAAGRNRVTDAIYLSPEEQSALNFWVRNNHRVEIQTFPGDILHLRPDGNGGFTWHKS